jgi:hypothetical protein
VRYLPRVRRSAILLAAALLAAAAAGPAPAAAPTRLERWTAFRGGKVAAGIHVLERGRGSCFAGSLADPRADAWRCLLGNEILDPCFSGGAGVVLCPDGTPDSRDAAEIRLRKPLPRGRANPPGDPTRRPPWVIVTATGAYCYRVTGMSAEVAGKPITYVCAGASSIGGTPDRTKPVWTVSLLPTGTSKRYVTVAVRAAWW